LQSVESATTLEEINELELIVNALVKERKIRVYHGLVLRNAIEAGENRLIDEFNEEE
jgi:hypothetical protein